MIGVRVVGHNHVGSAIARVLEDAGFRSAAAPALAVVIDWPDVATLFRNDEQSGLPWMLVEDAGGGAAAVGPIFSREGAGCFRCYIQRRRSNGAQECRPLRSVSSDVLEQIKRAVHAFASGEPARNDEQVEIQSDGLLARHAFMPLPNCSRCRLREPTSRVSVGSLVSNRLGIIHEVRQIRAPDPFEGIVAYGCRTDAFGDTRALNQGTAVDDTLEGARSRAIGESVERYCGSFAPPSLVFARSADLDGPFLDPVRFGGRNDDEDGNGCLHWVRATRLLTGEHAWAPAFLVYIPYQWHHEGGLGAQSSVGLAAGRSLDEAIHHGFAEIIERDACLRAWRAGSAVEKVRQPYISMKGLHLARVPSDSGLQIVTAFLEQRRRPFTSTGLAARPALVDAVRHATLEAALSRVWMEEVMADAQTTSLSLPRTMIDHARAHAVCEGLIDARRPWLEPSRMADGADEPKPWSEITQRYPEASFVDVTTDDVSSAGLKVARVLIPDLVTADDDALNPRIGGCTTPHPFA